MKGPFSRSFDKTHEKHIFTRPNLQSFLQDVFVARIPKKVIERRFPGFQEGLFLIIWSQNEVLTPWKDPRGPPVTEFSATWPAFVGPPVCDAYLRVRFPSPWRLICRVQNGCNWLIVF